MTTVDPSKVNLSERDIEDWLWKNPNKIDLGAGWYIDYWLARQFKVESGVIDLVGICRTKYSDTAVHIAIVEVKNVEIKADALTQVCRYAADIQRACDLSIELLRCNNWHVIKVVVGPEISNATYREARALEIGVVKFLVDLDLKTSQLSWSNEYLKKIDEGDMQLADTPVIREFTEAVTSVLKNTDRGEGVGEKF